MRERTCEGMGFCDPAGMKELSCIPCSGASPSARQECGLLPPWYLSAEGKKQGYVGTNRRMVVVQ